MKDSPNNLREIILAMWRKILKWGFGSYVMTSCSHRVCVSMFEYTKYIGCNATRDKQHNQDT